MDSLKEGFFLQGEMEYSILGQLSHGDFGITYIPNDKSYFFEQPHSYI